LGHRDESIEKTVARLNAVWQIKEHSKILTVSRRAKRNGEYRGKDMIAIDLGGTNIRGAVIDQNHNIIYRIKQETVKTSAGELIRQITDLSRSLGQLPVDTSSVGVSVAGSVNHRKGMLIETPNLPFPLHFPLKSVLEENTSLPVLVASELKVAALGELYFGAAKDRYSNIVVLTIGTGVGAGVIINGKLYHGKNYIAGEMGHTVVEGKHNAVICGCGRRGCIEAYSAGPSLARRMEAVSGQIFHPATILEMAANGDPHAETVLKEASVYIGICIANVVMYYDPEIIVLRGSFILNAWANIEEYVRRTVKERTMFSEAPIVLSELDDDGALYGLAALVTSEADA
jgi:glucokinase